MWALETLMYSWTSAAIVGNMDPGTTIIGTVEPRQHYYRNIRTKESMMPR